MAGTEETPRVRPLPWKVKAVILVCAIKAVIMTIKMPYVIFQTYTSLPGAGIFQAAIAASTLLGSWLMPRVVRSSSQPVIAWFIHLCSLAGNTLALVMPDSLAPILPSSIVSPTFLATLLMAGCSEHFQATDEEALAWGWWAATAFGAASALAPVVVPFIAEFEPVNFFCFAADALVTLPMLALPMPKEPKEQQAAPSAWSWAQTLRMRSLRTAPVLWMLSWSFVQALEHSMLEMVILVHMTTTLTPSVIQLSMFGVLGQGLAPATYSIVFGGPVQRLYSRAPRLLLLGLCLFLSFLRGLSFQMTSLIVFYLLAIAGAYTGQAVGHIKQLLWAELITQEDEAEGIAGLRGTIDGIVSLTAPIMALAVFGSFSVAALASSWGMIAASVIIYGQAGLNLFLPARRKPKEE